MVGPLGDVVGLGHSQVPVDGDASLGVQPVADPADPEVAHVLDPLDRRQE